jgi:hypothetical protein
MFGEKKHTFMHIYKLRTIVFVEYEHDWKCEILCFFSSSSLARWYRVSIIVYNTHLGIECFDHLYLLLLKITCIALTIQQKLQSWTWEFAVINFVNMSKHVGVVCWKKQAFCAALSARIIGPRLCAVVGFYTFVRTQNLYQRENKRKEKSQMR